MPFRYWDKYGKERNGKKEDERDGERGDTIVPTWPNNLAEVKGEILDESDAGQPIHIRDVDGSLYWFNEH